LEHLRDVAATIKEKLAPKRRGRKFMDEAERREVSARMKDYWAARRMAKRALPVSPDIE
jgi:hypothetical protein